MAPDTPQGPPEVVVIPGAGGNAATVDAQTVPAEPGGAVESTETVAQPAKVMRIGSMIRQLLEEVRQAPMDEKSRTRLREIYDTSVRELSDGLSPDLAAELGRISHPFEPSAASEAPSEAELRVAQAQLVGWLEGLFQGIQATLFAQQVNARSQLEEMRRRQLPSGDEPPGSRPGTYL